MKSEIQILLDNYINWVKDKTVLREVEKNPGWFEITTPNLDRHNDYLQIYIKKEGDNFIISDDGYTINDLIDSGCEIATPKREEILKSTLMGFGVNIKENELFVKTSSEKFPLKKHDLLQAMLAVNDLFYLSQSTVKSLFFEDVEKWLNESEIRFIPKIKFTGRSGYDHLFDFVIPKSKKFPERILQTINNPRKDAAESLVFKWLDTKESRSTDSTLYAILNDMNEKIPDSVINAFKNYDATPVLWSSREIYSLPLAS